MGISGTNRDLENRKFEIVSYRGEIFGPYASIEEAREAAGMKWPDQWQDEERESSGWDIQVVGS